jgi:hypothetical protein
MATRLAWVLNLDADLELGTAGRYDPPKNVRLAMKPHIATLARSLLGPEDILVDEESAPLAARGLPGRAFCPTPRALAILRRAGAEPEAHPPVAVLRQVNSRAFSASLGPTLPGSAFVTDPTVAQAMLAEEPPVGVGWRVKHAFGMAGRNQRVVAPASADAQELAFVKSGLARGGVQIEPNVTLEEEYGIHGLLGADRSFRAGQLVRQRCDPRGAWLATEPLAPAEAVLAGTFEQMAMEVRLVADALLAAGYFGPFGIDAFAYRDRSGSLRLQPRSEINARYSMGFAAGFGSLLAT